MNTGLVTVVFMVILNTFSLSALADRREYQHGIDFVSLGKGKWVLFWSSSPGVPPQGQRKIVLPNGEDCHYFTHDVYFSLIDSGDLAVDAKPLIRLPEAQEPVSAAISTNGVIFITLEDGSKSDLSLACAGDIQQRYQLFSKDLLPLSPLHNVAVSGGHSGHAAAVGDRFVVVYAEGWIDDEEGEGYGTGNDIMLDVVDERGEPGPHQALAMDRGVPAQAASRDWWPLVAGSQQRALIVWQRYVSNSHRANLMYAVYDLATQQLIKPATLLETELYYYHYDVQYLAAVKRFMVVGNRLGNITLQLPRNRLVTQTQKGFAYLLDENGGIVDHWDATSPCEDCRGYLAHPFVREAQPAILNLNRVDHTGSNIFHSDISNSDISNKDISHKDISNKGTVNDDNVRANTVKSSKVLYPVKPSGLLMFTVTMDTITSNGFITDDYFWHALGTDGIFLDAHTAFFATLSPQGLRTRIIKAVVD